MRAWASSPQEGSLGPPSVKWITRAPASSVDVPEAYAGRHLAHCPCRRDPLFTVVQLPPRDARRGFSQGVRSVGGGSGSQDHTRDPGSRPVCGGCPAPGEGACGLEPLLGSDPQTHTFVRKSSCG